MSYLFMAASPRGRGSDVLASKPTPSGMMYDHHYQKISLQPTHDLAPLRVILSMKNKLRSPHTFKLLGGKKCLYGDGDMSSVTMPPSAAQIKTHLRNHYPTGC